MSQTGIPEDRLPEEGEEGHRRTLQDHLQVEEVAVEEVAEEHSRCPGTHLPNPLKSF